MRNLDLLVLAAGLAVFIAAGLPIGGWVATTVGWSAARVLQTIVERRGMASGQRRIAR